MFLRYLKKNEKSFRNITDLLLGENVQNAPSTRAVLATMEHLMYHDFG